MTTFSGSATVKKIKFNENQQFVLEDASALQDLIVEGYMPNFTKAVFGDYVGVITGNVGAQATAANISAGVISVLPSRDLVVRAKTARWNQVVSSASATFPDGDGIFNLGWNTGDPLISVQADAYYTDLEAMTTAAVAAYNTANGTSLSKSNYLLTQAATDTTNFKTTYLFGKIIKLDTKTESRQIFDDASQASVAQNVFTRTEYQIDLTFELRDGDVNYSIDSTQDEGKFMIATSRSFRTQTVDGAERVYPFTVSVADFAKVRAANTRIFVNTSSNIIGESIQGQIRQLADYMAAMNNDGSDDPTMTAAERNRNIIENALPVNSLAGLRKRLTSAVNTNEVIETIDEQTAENSTDANNVPFTQDATIIARASVAFNDSFTQGNHQDGSSTHYVDTGNRALYPPKIWRSSNNAYSTGISYPVNAGDVDDDTYSFGFGVPITKDVIVGGNPTGATFVDRFNYIFTPIFNPDGVFYLMLRPGFTDEYTVHNVVIRTQLEGTSYANKNTQDQDYSDMFAVQVGGLANQRYVKSINMLSFGDALSNTFYNGFSPALFSSPVSSFQGVHGTAGTPAAATLGTGKPNTLFDTDHTTDGTAQQIFTGTRVGIGISTPLLTPALMTDQVNKKFQNNAFEFGTMRNALRDNTNTAIYTSELSLYGDNVTTNGVVPAPFTLIVEVYGTKK